MLIAEILYWIWGIAFVFFALLYAVSFLVLVNIKKNHFQELWRRDLEDEIFPFHAQRKVFNELERRRPKWIEYNKSSQMWFFLYKWSKWMSFIVIIFPFVIIFLLYFLNY